ncbi:MAG: ADP-ribosylglycohydrolase family protein [Clostridia bacterium]|nr:ADP-ribosylglycohydrolase family protein [Clostridia bacterium]MBQ4623775.1 ADP-ribosylglycohydrolase family protein [Clostridia bacterium]
MKDINRYRGCLIGGAVGDALGYPVEFWLEEEIFSHYGEKGITEYAIENGDALISDDTQMTLFTANGLLLAAANGESLTNLNVYPQYIGICYRDWLKTQTFEEFGVLPQTAAWLNNIPALNHPRAPGNTCISALFNPVLGSMDVPLNESKGCGGVMRVAPIGLYFDDDVTPPEEITWLGGEAAALTHGHELGYLPAAMLAQIIQRLVHHDTTVLEAVEDAKTAILSFFPNTIAMQALMKLVDLAISYASLPFMDSLDGIHMLGEGWVAEETLAIAIYCALRYETDFEAAMIAAVNHGGDSDSTGAVTGNILGARLGLEAIPKKFLDHLELRDTIQEIADDLFYRKPLPGKEAIWDAKYLHHNYPG